MEETNSIINDEIKPKRVYTEAQLRAVKAFRERNRDSEEYNIKQRANSKRSYEKNREKVLARVRANQRRNQEIEQLERLHESKEQDLVTFEKLSLKDSHELLNNPWNVIYRFYVD
jgi:hypothetical protein